MSYGTNITDACRQVGVYAGRILKGAKPADLPVVQATKFELVINAQTARMLGLDRAADAARPRRRGDRMKRREFITLLGGAAAAWPLAARAQQPAMPVIGFLDSQSPDAFADRLRAFRQGLKETGYVEGENVAIEYRWAENQIDRLPALAAELVRRRVAVIVATGGPPAALAAKAATTTIPIVFVVGEDPVRLGLVASLARPGGNLTGINFFASELAAKRLELLRELVPAATRVAVLVNPANATTDRGHVERRGSGCSRHGAANPGPQRQHQPRDRCGLRNLCARAARRPLRRQRALFHQPACPIGSSWRRATRSPRSIGARQFAEAGGLMSYGANLTDAYRQVGVYTGRILKGAKPADLPVVQSTQVRAGHQRRDRQDARPHRAAVAARRRRRGDRMRRSTKGLATMKLPRRKFLHLAAGAAALPGRVAHRTGASLSIADGAHRRRLSRRAGDRHRRRG